MLKICLTGNGYNEQNFTSLSKKFDITHKPEYVSQEEFQKILPEFDAYVLGGDERFTEQELKYAKKLQIISFVGTGYTSFIDDISATQYNIAIKNTPSVMAPAVAEHTIGLLIGLQRKLFQKNWEVKNSSILPCTTQELSSLCVGIIGLGEIGSRVARILRHSFGSQVIYTSRTPKKSIESELNITQVSLEILLSSADVIILSLPTNTDTEYFLNDAFLEKAKEGVMIINTAGARLIEPVALKKYIDNHKISSVAFDGYYIEPLPNVLDDPFHLLSLPDSKFVVTPHIAAKTAQSWRRMVDMAIDNVIQFFNE